MFTSGTTAAPKRVAIRQANYDDPPLAALIACQAALAALQLPDLERVTQHLAAADQLDPDSLQLRSVRINLRVQRARIAVRDDRDFSLDEARAAMHEARELRDTMIGMARWEESGRLLMLAANVPLALRDPASAQRLRDRLDQKSWPPPTAPRF